MRRSKWAGFWLLMFVAAACSSDDPVAGGATAPTAAVAPITTSETVTTSAPPPSWPPGSPVEAIETPDDWVLPGRDYGNSRATFDSPISTDNVGDLEVAWEAEVGGALSTVPLIVGGVVYVPDGSGSVHALDAETGVVALDAATGEELWVSEITATPTTGIDIQPVVFDGLVMASTVPVSLGGIHAGGDRGVLHALDAATGEVRWTFDTVESADLWGNPEVNSGEPPARSSTSWSAQAGSADECRSPVISSSCR